METRVLLEKICKELQETKTSEWSKVELLSGVNPLSHFESEISFIGDDQYQYPKDTRTWGVEIFVDDKCVVREYDVIGSSETDREAEERMMQKTIVNIAFVDISNRIRFSNNS